MKIAFSRPTADMDEQETLFQGFTQHGYDGLQLKQSQFSSYIQEPDLFLERWGHLDGVSSGFIVGGKLDEENQEEIRQIISFGEKLNTDLIVVCIAQPREGVAKEDIQKYAHILSELGKESLQKGIQLSLHHHHNQPIMYKEDFHIFFEAISDQSVGLTIDTAHLVKSGITAIPELIYDFKEVINNYHLKDFANGDFKLLGMGELDFKPIIQAIEDTGYNGWVSADEESGGEIVHGMKHCISFIKSNFNATSSNKSTS